MKKLLPFVFPAAAVLIVILLGMRWYKNMPEKPEGEIGAFGEGVEIENLSESELGEVMQGVGDVEKVKLTGEENSIGEVRYEVKDDKVLFSVMATLPELENGLYQVWLQEVDSQAKKKAFVLTPGKGGYMGSAAISTETLPFKVVVTREETDDDNMETVLLEGIITQDKTPT